MTPCSIAPLARNDLDEIWDYIAADNPSAAERLLSTFHEKFLLLSRHPLLGQAREELLAGLRSLSVGNYVVYYRVRENRVQIVRVLHGARDVTTMF
jgi:toxin ParE1/3/4